MKVNPEGEAQQPPKKKGHKVLWTLLGIVVVIVIIIIATTAGGGSDTQTAKATGDSSAQTTTTAKDAEEQITGLNTPLAVGPITWTVTAAKTMTKLHVDNQFIDDKTTSGLFLWVDLTIKNGKDEAVTADSSAVSVVDSQKREFKAYTDAYMYIPEGRQLFLESINPGMDRAGTVVFEIPKDAKGLQLSVGDLDLFGGKQGLITLGI